jgi:hypothetical protein
MVANLTPKMSELEITDAIGGHYPNYIQRALLSANVKTIQEALSFLNKLQIMEDGETRNSSSSKPPMSRPEHSLSAGQNQSGHYKLRSQPQNIRYMRYRENSSYDQNRQYNQHSSDWELQMASLQRQRHSQLNPNADLYSLEKRLTIRVTGRHSQKYPVRKIFISQCRGAYIGLVWGRHHRSSSIKGDRCIIRNA